MRNSEVKNFIKYIFDSFKKRQNNYLATNNISIFKNIIIIYLTCVKKPKFETIINNYKEEYIFNESRVDKNITIEEQLGIGEMYDYICDFDFSKDSFNLFTTSLVLHSKLYSKCIYKEYGGKLRDTTVYLFDTNIEVVDPIIAQKYFNSLIPVSNQIFDSLNDPSGGGYFTYIDNCIKQIVDLIKVQPFADGNKRTFRALLNLLLKRINIPPIYIELDEALSYKNALFKAIKENDYSDIINFYYYKICEAIVITLDIDKSIIKIDNQELKY